MGLRGPQPLPSRLRELLGRQPDPDEPRPAPVVEASGDVGQGAIPLRRFRPPAPLPPEGRAQWRRLSRVAARMRVLTEADAYALWMICRDWAMLCEVEDRLRDDSAGLVDLTKSGRPVLNPLFVIQRKLHESILRGLREFGFTPAARRGVRTVRCDDSPADGVLDGQWRDENSDAILRRGRTGKIVQ